MNRLRPPTGGPGEQSTDTRLARWRLASQCAPMRPSLLTLILLAGCPAPLDTSVDTDVGTDTDTDTDTDVDTGDAIDTGDAPSPGDACTVWYKHYYWDYWTPFPGVHDCDGVCITEGGGDWNKRFQSKSSPGQEEGWQR